MFDIMADAVPKVAEREIENQTFSDWPFPWTAAILRGQNRKREILRLKSPCIVTAN